MKFVCRDGEYVAVHLGEVIHNEKELDDLLNNFLPNDDDAIDPPETDTDIDLEDLFD